MKIGIVVQRYGREIVGGAELHCRFIVDHLKADHEIHVLTSCAKDYLTWTNEYDAGEHEEDGVTIHRFPVSRTRNRERFNELSYTVSYCPHTVRDELDWIEEQGPVCPDLLRHISDKQDDYDYLLFFSFRYWLVYSGLPLAPKKSILVPTAENDRIIHLSVFRDFFNLPGAIAYNSVEEREMIESITGNTSVPGVVVGVGLSEQDPLPREELYRRFDLRRKFVVYIGRLEAVKGCATLVDYYLRYIHDNNPEIDLVFVGRGDYTPPKHATIQVLQDVSEAEKMAIINASQCLVMPSPFESLSMVLLEAFSIKKPVLANGDCPVLRGQCLRSGGGLYYRNYDEFELCLQKLLNEPDFSDILGKQGWKYYQENYTWPTIMAKYDKLLEYCGG